jgi:hypothetical protein
MYYVRMTTPAYEYEHSVETTAAPEAIWNLWSDVSTWPDWDGSVEKVELEGPFAVGSEGTMTIPGQPLIRFRLVEVSPGARFTDETVVQGALLRFMHTLEKLEGGRTLVTHRVEIEAPRPMAGELGPMITADVPDAMRALVAAAEASRV